MIAVTLAILIGAVAHGTPTSSSNPGSRDSFAPDLILGDWHLVARTPSLIERRTRDVRVRYRRLDGFNRFETTISYKRKQGDSRSLTMRGRFDDPGTWQIWREWFLGFIPMRVAIVEVTPQSLVLRSLDSRSIWLLYRSACASESMRRRFIEHANRLGISENSIEWVSHDRPCPKIASGSEGRGDHTTTLRRPLGCAPAKDKPESSPIALVLGGGGVRGFAHVGALKAIEERGIEVDLVVGTSVGALVGALYASGLPPSRIEALARDVHPLNFVDIRPFGPGLLKGERLSQWVSAHAAHGEINMFPKRFAAVAVDLRSGDLVAITSGSVGEAVQASSAIPWGFRPVEYEEKLLVDGGLLAITPIDIARAMGANHIIAIDIYCGGSSDQNAKMRDRNDVLLAASRLQICALSRDERARADVLVEVDAGGGTMPAFRDRDALIALGYETTRNALSNFYPQPACNGSR